MRAKKQEALASDITVIHKRASCRSYTGDPAEPSKLDRLRSFCEQLPDAPFGSRVRISLMDFNDADRRELRELRTYGNIRNAPHFMVGLVEQGRHSMLDFGYLFELAVLEAERLGLNTCWIGGTFQRSAFAGKLDIDDDELLPSVCAVGYSASRRGLTDNLVRLAAGSRKRRPWGELFSYLEFWDGNVKPAIPLRPLHPDATGPYREALEAVRVGPSASNQQPWRIIRYSADEHEDVYQLFVQRTPGYGRAIKDIDIQLVDLGIAMCHFALAACEKGVDGAWVDDRPDYLPRGLEYVATWRAF
jgi:nitroreductase